MLQTQGYSKANIGPDRCEVALELAGPGKKDGQIVVLITDVIRGLAGRVIQICFIERGGVGGFFIDDFVNMVNHVTSPTANLPSLAFSGSS